MNQLYFNIGISKQAVSQYTNRQERFDQQIVELMAEVEDVRRDHPGCGLEKIYYTLSPNFIGRDRFIETFTDLGFRLKKKVNYKRTTYSSSSNFTNLIKGMIVNSAYTIWQTDITYFAVGDCFYYGVFIIDVYTKVIVGHQVSDNMRATANIKAINMALDSYQAPKIHHSDRGSQYTCKEYLRILRQNKCKISMAQSAQDNAYAERINSTIKNEYLAYWEQTTFQQLKSQVDKAVFNYNNNRLHNNLDRQIPKVFNEITQKNRPGKNKKMIIFNNED